MREGPSSKREQAGGVSRDGDSSLHVGDTRPEDVVALPPEGMRERGPSRKDGVVVAEKRHPPPSVAAQIGVQVEAAVACGDELGVQAVLLERRGEGCREPIDGRDVEARCIGVHPALEVGEEQIEVLLSGGVDTAGLLDRAP